MQIVRKNASVAMVNGTARKAFAAEINSVVSGMANGDVITMVGN